MRAVTLAGNAYASRPIHRFSGGVIEKHGRSADFRIITRSLTADFFGAHRRASVPLDFGRCYVYVQVRFNCDAWCTALTVDCGIVTTKPMMLPLLRWRDVNGELPGIALTEHSHPLRIERRSCFA
jgi:hypothetical protein